MGRAQGCELAFTYGRPEAMMLEVARKAEIDGFIPGLRDTLLIFPSIDLRF